MQVGTAVPGYWREGQEYVMGGVGNAQGASAGGFEKGDLVVLRRSSGMSTPRVHPALHVPPRIMPQTSALNPCLTHFEAESVRPVDAWVASCIWRETDAQLHLERH